MSADFTDFVGAKSQEDLMESLAFLSFENLCLGLGFFCPFPFFLFFSPQGFGWVLRIKALMVNGVHLQRSLLEEGLLHFCVAERHQIPSK